MQLLEQDVLWRMNVQPALRPEHIEGRPEELLALVSVGMAMTDAGTRHIVAACVRPVMISAFCAGVIARHRSICARSISGAVFLTQARTWRGHLSRRSPFHT